MVAGCRCGCCRLWRKRKRRWRDDRASPTANDTDHASDHDSRGIHGAARIHQSDCDEAGAGDSSRWFVAEKSGVIRVFANNASSSSSSIFFDISADVASSGEGGLLGFAFHPDFPTTPEVFVSYTRGGPFRSFVSRFYSTDNGQTLSPVVEDVLIINPQPATNHNGGDIAFGPDGLLYVGFGDGGGSGDPNENGQNTMNIHSAIVRIDVDGSSPYEIPAR